MNKYCKIALVLALLVFVSFLPHLNGGFCTNSVDENVALLNVTNKFRESLSPNIDAGNGVSCSVSSAERVTQLAEVNAKWQATCVTKKSTEIDIVGSKSNFYYITRCGFVSYAYTF